MTVSDYGNLCVSIQGRWNRIRVSKNVIRALGLPDYVSLRVNENYTSFLILPCDSKDLMSFKVPTGITSSNKKEFRIFSKAFVDSILEKNGFDTERTYKLYGKYLRDKNAVLFRMITGSVQANDRI